MPIEEPERVPPESASFESASAQPVEEPAVASAEPADGSGLSGLDRAVLDLAARGWTGPGPRDRAVRERLGMSPTAYFQHLNALLDDPAALRHDPVTVNRWRAARARHEENR